MACLRDRNIRIIVAVVILSAIIASCRGAGLDDEYPAMGYSVENAHPLDFTVDYISGGFEGRCQLSVQGDSLYFYDVEMWQDKNRRLMEKKRLKDWQVRNLYQLREAAGSDTSSFRCHASVLIIDAGERMLSIDGRLRLYDSSRDSDPPAPPVLWTLYRYLQSISPYDYEKNEWLEYR